MVLSHFKRKAMAKIGKRVIGCQESNRVEFDILYYISNY